MCVVGFDKYIYTYSNNKNNNDNILYKYTQVNTSINYHTPLYTYHTPIRYYIPRDTFLLCA